ncbi:hypothetical protein HYT84_02990 [Candidatus Micrarchaeota archaeon]|nr:hypothetical protein [Candidatus Micrarchaeota archaeon]
MDKMDKVKEKTYRFLLTTNRRDGINRVFIGVVDQHLGMYLDEMQKDEKINVTIRRIAKKTGLGKIVIKKYLGRVELKINGQTARQFNFEVE